MSISVFDLFSLGIGPSSSHTVGPMRAARRFAASLEHDRLEVCRRVRVELFGSLALTGKGHGTDRAVLMGLEGESPETVDPTTVDRRVAAVGERRRLRILGSKAVAFDPETDLDFRVEDTLPRHSNGMRFTAYDAAGELLASREYYSVGGGFVVEEGESEDHRAVALPEPPLPFHSGEELLAVCRRRQLSIWQVMLANEQAWHPREEIRRRLLEIAEHMRSSIEAGCRNRGRLPGGLEVPRRAPGIFRELDRRAGAELRDPLTVLDWVNLFAIAVCEENAAGGRVVTAPTNGAAGIVPAVLEYYRRFVAGSGDDGIVELLLTAAAVGILFKKNASISGAEVGCQGEVGVACSMASAGLAAVLGGSPAQVENAAEIGMEHNLGLTCDPIGGLVQIPCIERNAMGATKAINAARLALKGDGSHKVSLDKVISTMRQTGADMMTRYKETSLGGLAVHVIEC